MTLQSREITGSGPVVVICPQCGKKDGIEPLMSSYLCNRCELVFSRREAKQMLIIVRLQEEIRKLIEELEGCRKRR